MVRICLLLILLIISTKTISQVSNDDIRQLTFLVLNDSPLVSRTNQSTVQWECVNKISVAKCLVYHNDQWFAYKPIHQGTYFLNISDQSCKNKQGIQMVIIEGDPCQTNSYKILTCIPTIEQDDLFITLDSLKQNTQYLFNIDGFLEDFCVFKIQISETPKGIPFTRSILDSIPVQINQSNNIVKIIWEVSESSLPAIDHFEIWRKEFHDIKYTLLKKMPLIKNTYGLAKSNYVIFDTLQKEGQYKYQIITTNEINNDRSTVAEKKVRWIKQPFQYDATIALNYKMGTPIQITVMDNHGMILHKMSFIFDEKKDAIKNIALGKYLEEGKQKILIKIMDLQTKAIKYYTFAQENTN
jgi:hypothetical protein